MSVEIKHEQVEALKEKGRTIVTIDNCLVYDVTDFLEDHPGGPELVAEFAGQDITKVMADPNLHPHSESAYTILQEYMIGKLPYDDVAPEVRAAMSTSAAGLQLNDTHERMLYEAIHECTDTNKDYVDNQFIDFNKPLLWQVMTSNWSRDFYIQQVHKPRHYRYGSAPIFGNFLEPLSLTPWWLIPLVWVPANIIVQTVPLKHESLLQHFSLYAFGLCLWTLVEYVLHRVFFHLDYYLPENRVCITLHFLLHGVHHFLPMDRMRLVMPPALMMVLTTPLYYLCHFVFRAYYPSISIFTGAHMGYVFYDLTHYFIHHKSLPGFMRVTKIWHLDHHYKDFQRGFGVTSPFWDYVFGTTYIEGVKSV